MYTPPPTERTAHLASPLKTTSSSFCGWVFMALAVLVIVSEAGAQVYEKVFSFAEARASGRPAR